jgi:protein tyrosine/serine phosphatase
MSSADTLALAHEEFEGIANFRDFGGWATEDGGQVRRGLLFRSANHSQATIGDLQRMAQLGITLVVDLRRPPERRRDPAPTHESFTARVLHDRISPDDESIAPHLTFLQNVEKGEPWVLEWLTSSYSSYPFDEAYSAIFRDYFHALADNEGGVVVHCQAGKDRTGVLCALTLTALGVDRETIYRDYLETNRSTDVDGRLPALVERFQAERDHPVDVGMVRAAMSADARYLDAAFAEVEARHGDVHAYLEQALGVTPAMRQAIRRRLVTHD